MKQLLVFINDKLKKIKSFKEFSITANFEDDPGEILAKIVTLKDEQNFSLQNSGYGVQFLSLICLVIFEKLLVTGKYKKEKGYFEDEKGKRYTSLILGLDEPEIHLHPYMQRSLIKYLIEIILNKDEEFLDLLSTMFSINGFLGQIIVCTHSPHILLSNYKEIICFSKKNGVIKVKNGMEIIFEDKVEKHLLKNMPYVKEAFFSKCVILVEGDTEAGAFPLFSKKLHEKGRNYW